MKALRLYGSRDMRVDEVPAPGSPAREEVLLKVTATGICGSDLHTYKKGQIGDISIKSPLVLGHEFGGMIEEAGEEAAGGDETPLTKGMRVAIEPARPCGRCEMCEQGHPNLCWRLHFCGLYPDDGSLQEYMLVPARTCFPIPDSIDNVGAAMLEPLGIAIHAVDLAKLKVANSVAILGAGPVGLLILQVARLAGAGTVFISDRLDWRLKVAENMGGTSINCEREDVVAAVMDKTKGRGVDVAIEAAWGDSTIQQAGEIARMGGSVVIVGIPEHDRAEFKQSTFRRKGLTIRMCRRMKHTYPRAIQLAESGKVDFASLVSHQVPLEKAPEAFAMNADYKDDVKKVIISC